MSEVTPDAAKYLFTRLLLLEQEDALIAMRLKLNEAEVRRKMGTLTMMDLRDLDTIPVALKKLEKQFLFLQDKEKKDRAYTTPEEYAAALDADISKRKEVAARTPLSSAASQRLINLQRLKAMIGSDALAWKE